MSDIKMSDVFDLPMTVGSSQGITGCIDTELGDNNLWLADFFDEDAINDVCKANDMAEAAAHAINNHDPMALRIKELEVLLLETSNTLEAIIHDPEVCNVFKCHVDLDDISRYRNALRSES